ncbi:hypothetical protein P175DRAFT_0509942 [Aspergillus ochraceoroseus IBT 24754]|uniref:PAC domain-containing protein n=1 Tax=Aspergillus ochraceoroseus IBT 24754 TaxID=1392256 RepID=A0A2T5LUM9_9EURO|nr:uncharacterized protein P175DRAFT_0509942 [Aspergillus ochraceoroseus IBT 24754]PTU19980.1 hypothetical protein P175DRAFT_0509942 [Aspergillus ochraceoroseus IBT 24754]
MDGYTSFDTESLRSYTGTLNSVTLDQSGNYYADRFHDKDKDELFLHNFPSPPSIKTLRRNCIAHELPLLQELNPNDGSEQFHPVHDQTLSYDLIAPGTSDDHDAPRFPLERHAERMFSPVHMRIILTTPRFLAHFREFLMEERPRSLPALTYYLNAIKALKALEYANELMRKLPPSSSSSSAESSHSGRDTDTTTTFTTDTDASMYHMAIERRVHDALDALTAEELPAFITSTCIRITSTIVEERVRGTLPAKFQGTSDALAEVFCLTDPSRRDNPIIFSSEEFHRTTQYGMDYVLGRNCRFLQGPHTNRNSVRRIREAIEAGRHHSELFLNYRRDGSPFMNLLQCAPLCDSNGRVRYFIGAQIDVSGLAMEEKVAPNHEEEEYQNQNQDQEQQEEEETKAVNARKSEFHSLCELFSPHELNTVQNHGGHLFHPAASARAIRPGSSLRQPAETEEDIDAAIRARDIKSSVSLTGAYENYLLVRPYPSLRILFTSPSLQIPGILQSSFLSRIGSSNGVREELIQALMQGRSVTARIKWLTKFNTEGRSRWVHCTPLLASNGEVGVWMVVVVDDE